MAKAVFSILSLAMERAAYIQRLDNWMLGTDLHTKFVF
jgi:hypothetical protein